MRYGTIPGIDRPVSRIVQGCMMLREGDELAASFAILDNAIAQGINTFDHGHIYGRGRCERVFGQWLQERGNRDDLVIATKGCHHHGDEQRVTPAAIASDIADSLERLQVDRLDIWMFHRDDPSQPVGPLVEALDEQYRAGRIGLIGGSNWHNERIAAFNAYAAEHGCQPMRLSSPNFSLARQLDDPWGNCTTISGPEHEADRAWLQEQGMPVFTWSSLARGFLSGRITRENLETVRDQFEECTTRCYASDDNFDRLERAMALAEQRGCHVAQIALAFVLNQPFDAYALVASYTAEEAAANAAAVDIVLSPAEIAWLDLRSETAPLG